ncbi:MAG: hypothetical protein M3R70_01380 [Actinomycetota bacterium]|nr:hypothetical protein [Actinomycetota bacterium]
MTGTRLRPIAFTKFRLADSISEPIWSPRGTKVAWTDWSDPDDPEIFVADARGLGARLLAHGGGLAWSPKGGLIAYSGQRGIHLIAPSGRKHRRLTAGRSDGGPTWSPDGKHLAFERGGGNESHIYVVGSDGRGLRRLNDQLSHSAAWSPDGRQIAYLRKTDSTADTSAIYVVNVNGTHEYRATTPASTFGSVPEWSPDSTSLMFVRFVGSGFDHREIVVVQRDGTAERRVADRAFAPVWAPNGRRIAYTAEGHPHACGGRIAILVAKTDGATAKRVTPCRHRP